MKLLGHGATEKPSGGYDNLKENDELAMEAAKSRFLDGDIAVMELEPKKPETNYVMTFVSRAVFTFSMFVVVYFFFYSALNYYYTNNDDCQHGLRYQNKTYICMSRADIVELRKDIDVLKKVMDPELLFSADDEPLDEEEKEEAEQEMEKEDVSSFDNSMFLGSRVVTHLGKTYKVSAYMTKDLKVISERMVVKRHEVKGVMSSEDIPNRIGSPCEDCVDCSDPDTEVVIQKIPAHQVIHAPDGSKKSYDHPIKMIYCRKTKTNETEEATATPPPQIKVLPKPDTIKQVTMRIVHEIQETIKKHEEKDSNPNELPKEALDEWNEIKTKHAETAQSTVPTH